MPQAGAMALDTLMSEALTVLAADEVLALPADLEERIVHRLQDAQPSEIEEGLHILWRFMRNISREYCWTVLARQDCDDPNLREEIRAYFARQDEQQRRRNQVMPIERAIETLTTPGTLDSLRDYFLGPDELSRQIGDLSANLHGGQDPFDAHLPYPKAHTHDCWFPVGWVDYGARFARASRLLQRIAPMIYDHLPQEPIFWAVLGPVQDALHRFEDRDFGNEISHGELLFLRNRVLTRRADTWDYWLLFHGEAEHMQPQIFRAMLEHVQRASGSELEAFFEALHDQRENLDDRTPETQFPEPDRLWRGILDHAQSQPPPKPIAGHEEPISVRLLARGGLYYWETSRNHDGPSLMLAALGIALEGDLLLRLDGFSIPPFLPLWAAAKAAAKEACWDLARDCFQRALFDIRFFASGLTAERWHTAVDDFRYELGFVEELFLRFGDSSSQLTVALYFAVDALQTSGLPEDSVIRLKLEYLGRRHGVHALGDVLRLSNALGEDLWDRIEPETREILVEAERAWRTADFSAAGVHYRRAIEHEWRTAIGRVIASMLPEPTDSPSLGQMLRAVRDRATLAGAMLTSIVGSNSCIFDHHFLERALGVSRFLNPAAHPAGLDRQECELLRTILLHQGLLRDFFSAVQPRGES